MPDKDNTATPSDNPVAVNGDMPMNHTSDNPATLMNTSDDAHGTPAIVERVNASDNPALVTHQSDNAVIASGNPAFDEAARMGTSDIPVNADVNHLQSENPVTAPPLQEVSRAPKPEMHHPYYHSHAPHPPAAGYPYHYYPPHPHHAMYPPHPHPHQRYSPMYGYPPMHHPQHQPPHHPQHQHQLHQEPLKVSSSSEPQTQQEAFIDSPHRPSGEGVIPDIGASNAMSPSAMLNFANSPINHDESVLELNSHESAIGKSSDLDAIVQPRNEQQAEQPGSVAEMADQQREDSNATGTSSESDNSPPVPQLEAHSAQETSFGVIPDQGFLCNRSPNPTVSPARISTESQPVSAKESHHVDGHPISSRKAIADRSQAESSSSHYPAHYPPGFSSEMHHHRTPSGNQSPFGHNPGLDQPGCKPNPAHGYGFREHPYPAGYDSGHPGFPGYFNPYYAANLKREYGEYYHGFPPHPPGNPHYPPSMHPHGPDAHYYSLPRPEHTGYHPQYRDDAMMHEKREPRPERPSIQAMGTPQLGQAYLFEAPDPKDSLELTFVGIYDDVVTNKRQEALGRMIRVWNDTRKHLFYDCVCKKRKPIKNLKAMISHAQRHRDDCKKEEVFVCDQCGRQFTHYLGLNSHQRVHKQFSLSVPPQPHPSIMHHHPHPHPQMHYDGMQMIHPHPPPIHPDAPLQQ
jgi:hypothetical protein